MNKINNITDLFDAFTKLKVLIIGDVMIDAYLWGKVERISPEAPVPIVSVGKRENRLGGAANVAINIQALGATPVLCSVIGIDLHGNNFIELMQKQKLTVEGICQSKKRSTTQKTRIIGNNHQMLRVDEENDDAIISSEQKQLFERIFEIITLKKIDVIIFEDYDKGVISKSLIEDVVKLAKKKNIPVAVDPKKRNFNHYKNVSFIKPNLKELSEGMKVDIDKKNIAQVKDAATKLCKANNVDIVLVTLSEQGAFIQSGNEQHHIPAHVRNIADVSGAGDTVISVAALCLALNISLFSTASLSNLAGGLVCEKVGVAPIEKKQLLEEAGALKIF